MPTGQALSNLTLDEKQAAGQIISTFTTTDPDAGDSHTYTTVSGSGDFNIVGNSLRAVKPFDYETKSSYTLRTQTNDGRGGTFEKTFTISIRNVNEAATGITLSSLSIAENNAINISTS